MTNRAHNFFAGPAVLPFSVLEETRDAVMNFANVGVSIMEISHRSKEFDAVIQDAERDALAIAGLSAQEYSVIFLGGGASLQFAMVPMNFMKTKADYLITGEWATKAAKEAKMFGAVNEAGSSKDKNFNYLPKSLKFSPDADYVHITTNNTIYGTEWKSVPDTGNVPLLADMSSDMFGVKREWSRYSFIYAGAQKNLGPAGVTMVIIKRAYLEAKANEQAPTMLKYKTHVEKVSLFNTPPVIAVYVLGRTLKWILKEGGLNAIEARNQKKAKIVYDVIDAYPMFYKGTVADKADRSIMNLTWNLPTPELEEKFVAEAKAKKMLGLKGHRSVGGIRASLYNACPMESVEVLAKFMEEFYNANK
ncbi:MAG: 3-phosphoserine/phosphohydroxythreonine transaminase [Ignavibacteriales bacterium]|nr:3-phosphoserine/phosphohydroxythreonine transaminase [Ignavibacteriales bacterium]